MLSSLVFVSVLHYSHCARILGVFPIPSISHQIVYQPIWKELSLRGHRVTVLTPNPLKNSSLTNLTEIDMESTYKIFREDYIAEKMAKDNHAIDTILWLYGKIEAITISHFNKVERFLKDPTTEFDLIIVETLHPLVYSLGCRFKVPIIAVSSLGLLLQTHDSVGNPTHPVVGPAIFSNIVTDMGIYEKICSVLYNLWSRMIYYWYVLPRNDKIAKEFWGNDCPYIGDLERNVSLILVNTNPVVHAVRPNVPNIIEMGQMHIGTEKPLPQYLQKYLDMSTQGVVYFSLGTNVRSSNLSSSNRQAVVQALAELPYNVLWKLEIDYFPDKPKNVMTRKWFPQQDILRHKNVKVFVTQGGLQSIEEAVINCVPIVGIPFFADQPLNVMKLVKMGAGRSINHLTMTKEGLKEAIVDAAENERYREKVKELKDLFSDQPMNGLEKSVWWIEYVLRHKGARHLRSSAADMSWFEYFLLDVMMVLCSVLIVLFYCLRALSKFVKNKCKIKVD